MSNKDKMLGDFERWTESPNGNYLDAEGVKACAAIKDAEIEKLKKHNKDLRDNALANEQAHYSQVERLVKERAALNLTIKEFVENTKKLREELRACQAVIHLAGGFDPAYVNGAQAAMKASDALVAKSEHHNSRALEEFVDCGNCFEGKSDMNHICWKCNGTGIVKAQSHYDNVAVDNFAAAMKTKLKAKREQGKSGWQFKDACSNGFLSDELVKHMAKGDPVDVANFCMMLHQREERINSKALEKMLLEAEIKGLRNQQPVSNNRRLCELGNALAELNKE